ncbi:MAG: DUF1549 domain-containing protein, partial [Planctomycetota bacterium]
HGSKKSESSLRFDRRADALRGGLSGLAIVPGRPEESLLVRAIERSGELKMPPERALSALEIHILKRWIREGAVWPESEEKQTSALGQIRSGPITERERAFWSFRPVVRPKVPEIESAWARGPIDLFIERELAKRGLPRVGPAERAELLRRASFDLIGLPPTPNEIDSFVNDDHSDAFARVVDRLLDSPHYGERWGRHWLDVARYADTAGETADYPVPLAWQYRNWVIDALNADMPYDEFIRAQIAGDILAKSAPREQYESLVTATGYLAVSRRFGFGVAEHQYLTIQDSIDTIGQSILGLSLGCARCHDHKYDPISARDYYAWYGIFDSTRYALSGDEKTKKERDFVAAVPDSEATTLKENFDRRVGELSKEAAILKEQEKELATRSHGAAGHDPGFERQAVDTRPAEPWTSFEAARIVADAQSPFQNVYRSGTRGLRFPSDENNNHFGFKVQPTRTPANTKKLHFSLDFRNTSQAAGGRGAYRFYLGRGPGHSAAVELGASASTFFVKNGERYEPLRKLELGRWYNVSLTLDLTEKTYSGTVGAPGDLQRFEGKAFTKGWDGIIDQFFVDKFGPAGGASPARDFDNLAIRNRPFLSLGEEVSLDEVKRGLWDAFVSTRLFPIRQENADGHAGFVTRRAQGSLPVVGINITEKLLKIPGDVPPRGFIAHPAQKDGASIAWRSPIDGEVQIVGLVADAHNCGDSVTWFVDVLDPTGLRSLTSGATQTNGSA